MKSAYISNIHEWVENLIGYPGLSNDALVMRRNYWLASVVSVIIMTCLTIAFWIIHPELKVLLYYGVFINVLFLLYIIADILLPHNIHWLLLVNQILMIVGTFFCILKLGGIPNSGGLVFVGFFVVLFSLDSQKRSHSVWLIAIYVLTIILAGVLHPYLTISPQMPNSINVFLFVVNLVLIAVFSFLFVLNFISQRIRIEQREARRLKEWDDAKTKFYTNITHEFRTPLTVILGMADLIRYEPERWLQKGTSNVENSGKILLGLVNKMLELSKIESGTIQLKKTQGDVVLYLRHLFSFFQSLADRKNIKLNYTSLPNNFLMDYDPDKLLQIISNLVSNAIKYNLHGGKVEVKTFLTKESTQRFVISVRDYGVGIDKKYLPHIFDRFYRVESDTEHTEGSSGTGLGLALTLELVKLMKGTIGVESVSGKGTEFKVYLPVTNRAPLISAEELFDITRSMSSSIPICDEEDTSREDLPPKEKPLLLIVEDSEDVAEYLRAILKNGYQIHVAVNGKDGWEKARSLVPEMILSDIIMPEMDGIELLDRVKNDICTSHIPVIILTAKADIASRLTGLERGADAYIAKPFNKDELIIQMNRLVNQRKKLQERYSSVGNVVETQNPTFKIDDSFMKKIHDFMLDNLNDEKFNIEDLCVEMAMSRTQLYRKFKTLTNRTVFEYLFSIRLHKAKELLMTTNSNVSEIAFLSGFKNLSHFSRVFTDEFGVNPSKIREHSHIS